MHNARWWIIAGAALMVVVGLVVNQAHSAAVSITSQPLQNTGTDGALVYTGDYSVVPSVVTRHEGSTVTLNTSDQITSVTVDGTKATGTADVIVQLLDNLSAVLDIAPPGRCPRRRGPTAQPSRWRDPSSTAV